MSLIKVYLNFIKYVLSDDGLFYNYVDKDRKIDTTSWSEDAHGRAIWALGYLIGSDSMPPDLRDEAEKLLIAGLDKIENTQHLRSAAFAISGLYFYNQKINDKTITKKIVDLAERKAVVDLMPYVNKDNLNLDEYFPSIVRNYRYGNGLYALPFHLGPATLVYNKDIFNKEKVPYPDENWTWDNLLDARKRERQIKDWNQKKKKNLISGKWKKDYFIKSA